MRNLKYRNYIKSEAWRTLRQQYLISGLPKVCIRCKTPYRSGFHMHHLTYERLGHERLTDIVPCCQPCHKKIHKQYDKIKLARRKIAKELKLPGLSQDKKIELRQERDKLYTVTTLESVTKKSKK